ncbi:MAG: MBL fold metallo-hydrolase [Oscillospiraceae bacterium]|nr:MBL fold metallo-hydrolase [Oscillospiraceae bacterium]
MAKRKKQTGSVKKLLKMLPAALLIMLMCVGICLGALIETGLVSLTGVQQAIGIAPAETTDTPTGSDIPEEAKAFAVHVIDVGQGDSILILAGGKSILIDAGEKEYGGKVVSFIKEKGIGKLDYIIATHPHSDHIGGLAEVISSVGAEKIIVPKLPDEMVPTTRVYENFLKAVKNSGGKLTAAKAGNSYDIAEINGLPVKMTVLTPCDGAEYDDLNNYSVSVRVDYNRISWLLAGDLSEEGEKDLINSGADIDVTAYKVSHHGSSSSSSEMFLERVTPRLCVISCGEGNSYGHPHKETLNCLSEFTSSIYRTDQCSTVSVYSDGTRLFVSKASKEGE